MPLYVDVKPSMLNWAIQRAQIDVHSDAAAKGIVGESLEWISGKKKPTLKKLNQFASRVMVPFGHLFLDSPPEEKLPIADFRTFDSVVPSRPSPNLLETIQKMQLKQEWMRDHAIENEFDPIELVGSLTKNESLVEAARKIKRILAIEENRPHKNDAFNNLRDAADRAGVLVFLNGIVGANTRRPLDPEEFRGFVLVDEYAPLVFVNSNDTKTAQLFTLAHEIVHLALGKSGLFNLKDLQSSPDMLETRCNKIAAETLVASNRLKAVWKTRRPGRDDIGSIAKEFGVSPVVLARCAWDHELISRDEFFSVYHRSKSIWEANKAKRKEENKGGADFYKTMKSRMSRRFASAIYSSVGSGELLHRDAYDLLGLNGKTFENFRKKINEGRNE